MWYLAKCRPSQHANSHVCLTTRYKIFWHLPSNKNWRRKDVTQKRTLNLIATLLFHDRARQSIFCIGFGVKVEKIQTYSKSSMWTRSCVTTCWLKGGGRIIQHYKNVVVGKNIVFLLRIWSPLRIETDIAQLIKSKTRHIIIMLRLCATLSEIRWSQM